MNVGAWATAHGYGAAWSLLRHLPERRAYRLGDLIADRVTARNRRGVQRLRSNLRRAVAVDALEAAVRAGMRSYVRYWIDAFRLPTWSPERVTGSVRTTGLEPVATTLASGRGVVAALAHLGNWDHAGAWSCRELAPLVTVAERLEPADVFDKFVAFRTGLGMEILPLTGGPAPMPILAERLGVGGFAPLLADRDLTGRGVAVTLLGEAAMVASGPAVLAARTGAALHPVVIHYEPRADISNGWGLVIEFWPEVPIVGERATGLRAAVQGYADAWSSGIRAHPQDWHMLQRVFRSDLAEVSHTG